MPGSALIPRKGVRSAIFHYSVRDEQCTVVEDSHGGEPNAYLHGHGGIIRGLEEALEGRGAGDVFSVTIAPEKAYGLRKPDAVQRVPIKHLMGAKRWKAGMIAQVQTEQGPRHMVVAKVGHKLRMWTLIIPWLAGP